MNSAISRFFSNLSNSRVVEVEKPDAVWRGLMRVKGPYLSLNQFLLKAVLLLKIFKVLP